MISGDKLVYNTQITLTYVGLVATNFTDASTMALGAIWSVLPRNPAGKAIESNFCFSAISRQAKLNFFCSLEL